jgi:hypothetical protein
VQQNTRPSGQYQPSPNLNLGRFEANSQASAPNQNFSFPTAPFNPDIFKHFANASIPPPPPPNFPPVVIPNLAFPQFTQDLTASNATPFQPTGGVPAGSESHDAYDPRFPQQPAYNPRASSSFPAVHDVNAEGQRKDEGSASSRTVSHEEQAQEQSELYGKTRHPSNFDGQCFIDCNQFALTFPAGAVFSTHVPSADRLSHTAISNQVQTGSGAVHYIHEGQIRQQQATNPHVTAYGNSPD